MNIDDLVAAAKSDPSLKFTQVDIDRILDSIETTKTDFLEDKTWTDIHRDILLSLRSLGIPESVVKTHYNKLYSYRYVDEIHQLHRGKYARWIRLDDPAKITQGGIIVEIKFFDSGIHVTGRLYNGKYVQYAFDECLTFQRLTEEEQTILSLYSQIDDNDHK